MTTTKSGKHVTLGTNRLNLVYVISVVSLHGKDALGSLVLPHDTGAKSSLAQWGNIVDHVVTSLEIEMIFSDWKISLEGKAGLQGVTQDYKGSI